MGPRPRKRNHIETPLKLGSYAVYTEHDVILTFVFAPTASAGSFTYLPGPVTMRNIPEINLINISILIVARTDIARRRIGMIEGP